MTDESVNVASILLGTIDGLMLQRIMDPNLFRLDDVAEVLTKSYIKGLKK